MKTTALEGSRRESAVRLARLADADAVRARVASTVRDDVQRLERYPVADARGFIKLDAMEDPYPLPAALTEAVARVAARAAINRYPDADAHDARAALRRSLDLSPDVAILLGNGSDELIQIITATVARPDAGVLAPEPSFVMYRRTALIAKVPFLTVELRRDFSLDVDAMLAAIGRARPALVFVANPNNPTGNAFAASDIERIAAAAPGLVVVDEAYYAYADASFLPRVLEFPNVVVLRTVSKIGMAGLRLGYVVGHPAWIAEFDKVRPPYNVGTLPQAVLAVLLEHRDVFAAQAAQIRMERSRLAGALARRGLMVFPSQTNFVLARVADANAAFAALRDARILVKNLDGVHRLLANCLRITIGTPEENDALLAALDRHLEGGTR